MLTGVVCKELPPVGLNMKLHVESQAYGAQLTYHCEEGFKLNMNESNRTCQQNGKWAILHMTPACEGLFPYFISESVFISTFLTFYVMFDIHCNK